MQGSHSTPQRLSYAADDAATATFPRFKNALRLKSRKSFTAGEGGRPSLARRLSVATPAWLPSAARPVAATSPTTANPPETVSPQRSEAILVPPRSPSRLSAFYSGNRLSRSLGRERAPRATSPAPQDPPPLPQTQPPQQPDRQQRPLSLQIPQAHHRPPHQQNHFSDGVPGEPIVIRNHTFPFLSGKSATLVEDSTSDLICLQLDKGPHSDGIYRPGDSIIGTVTLMPQDKDGRAVTSVKAKIRGVRECHTMVPNEDADAFMKRAEYPSGMGSRYTELPFLLDHCKVLSKEHPTLASLPANEPLRLPFVFKLPEKIAATVLDEYTSDELARPSRLRNRASRLPLDLPPSMDVSALSSDVEAGAGLAKRATAWMRLRPGSTKRARVVYSIDVTVRRQMVGWTGGWGPTKKEKLSMVVCVQPNPPFSATAPAPRLRPEQIALSTRQAGDRSSLVAPRMVADSTLNAMREQPRLLQVDAGHLNTGGSPRLSNAPAGNDLQLLRNEQGMTQAWFRHSATERTGSAYMELSFPALASLSTGRRIPFVLHLSVQEGSQIRDPDCHSASPIRLALLRTVYTSSKFGNIPLESSLPMLTPSGEPGVRIVSLRKRDCSRDVLPHRAGAVVQGWEGVFMIEPYTIADPAVSGPPSSPVSPGAMLEPSQRTVPSFAFRNIHLNYSLVVEIDIQSPIFDEKGYMLHYQSRLTRLRVPRITVANESKERPQRPPPAPPLQLPRQEPSSEIHTVIEEAGESATPAGRPSQERTLRRRTLPTYSSLFLRGNAQEAQRRAQRRTEETDTAAEVTTDILGEAAAPAGAVGTPMEGPPVGVESSPAPVSATPFTPPSVFCTADEASNSHAQRSASPAGGAPEEAHGSEASEATRLVPPVSHDTSTRPASPAPSDTHTAALADLDHGPLSPPPDFHSAVSSSMHAATTPVEVLRDDGDEADQRSYFPAFPRDRGAPGVTLGPIAPDAVPAVVPETSIEAAMLQTVESPPPEYPRPNRLALRSMSANGPAVSLAGLQDSRRGSEPGGGSRTPTAAAAQAPAQAPVPAVMAGAAAAGRRPVSRPLPDIPRRRTASSERPGAPSRGRIRTSVAHVMGESSSQAGGLADSGPRRGSEIVGRGEWASEWRREGML